jgi:hypothetical protein
MAGKIIADQIEHSTAGSLDTQYVVNGVEKCWVNLNGTGTIAIRGSLNVASLTDNGTGDYQINYVSAAADLNYSSRAISNQYHCIITNGLKATSSNNVRTFNSSHSPDDPAQVNYGFLGDLA